MSKQIIQAVTLASSLLAFNASAETLLAGKVLLANQQEVLFSLSGQSREDIINGEIQLGDAKYKIDKQSRLGLIGAQRTVPDLGEKANEYALFSSSFSTQTATGRPWVSAREYYHCNQPYNAFLALYQVKQSNRLEKLGPVPYPILAEGQGDPTQALVYCFMARPLDH